MKDFFKKNWQVILVGLTTLVLAGVALVTAWKLYQIGQEPVAPTAPTSIPQAVEKPCVLDFTVQATPSPSPSPSPSATPSPSPSPEPSPSSSPEPSPSPSPEPSPSPSAPPSSPKPSPSPQPSPSPEVELPEAGIISPTILATLGGIILILIGLLL